MKILVIVVLVLIGVYWLIDHTNPLPLNHEQLGLYDHTAHRIVGIVFFVIAGLVGLFWKPKKELKVEDK